MRIIGAGALAKEARRAILFASANAPPWSTHPDLLFAFLLDTLYSEAWRVKHFHWSAAPDGLSPIERRNFLNVQVDAVGIGLASAAAPFLPVFLARLGASNVQVGLLTSMPALTGLFLAIAVGQFLQSRRNIVPWFSAARFMVVSSYALTGLVPFLVPRDMSVAAVLAIWAVATLPQTVVNVAFNVVMNAVAGPERRYDLLSRRWSILGFTTALAVAAVGEILDQISFPFNYQVAFIALSLGGLISFYFSIHIELPDVQPPTPASRQSLPQRVRGYIALVRGEKPFISFVAKRFVYFSGSMLAVPLFPLYYVRVVQANDAWIGVINTAQSAVLLFSYALWSHQTRVRGSRFVLLATSLGLSLYPALTAWTHQVEWIAIYAGLAGVFQAGMDLVFFDELMRTVPPEYSATFVSFAQSTQYAVTFAAPVVGTILADQIGLGGALVVSGALRLVAFALFALPSRVAPFVKPVEAKEQLGVGK